MSIPAAPLLRSGTGVSGVARQRGIAMIALITLLTLISAYYIAQGLNRTSTQVTQERNRRSNDALLEAKAALIAWAAGVKNLTATDFQPGSFPCPDTNDDGYEEPSCTTAS